MFGIGPLLPYTRITEKPEFPSSKASNPGSERTSHAEELTEHAISSRPSPKLSTGTFVEASEEDAVEVSNHESCHRRDPSLIVNFDLERTVQQLRAGDSSDLDLALFAYWIRAKEDNYVTAQGFVRELALDQGYNINKIPNPCLQKLLQDLHDIRPRFVPTQCAPSASATAHSPSDNRAKMSNYVLPFELARKKPCSAVVGHLKKLRSNKVNSRNPQDDSISGRSFQSKTQVLGRKASCSTVATSSSRTPRTETLPPSLLRKRNRVVEKAARPTPVVYYPTGYDYPPNCKPVSLMRRMGGLTGAAPDRPAPLSVRSRSSLASYSRVALKTVSRSVSTPIESSTREDLPAIPRTNGRKLIDLRTKVMESHRDYSDIFDCAPERICNQGALFTDRLQGEDRHHGTLGNSEHHIGPYQLDASDVASESSYTSSSMVRSGSCANTRTDAEDGIDTTGKDSFDALESYVTTDDEYMNEIIDEDIDECSSLGSVSASDNEYASMRNQFVAHATAIRQGIEKMMSAPPKRRQRPEGGQIPRNFGMSSAAINFRRPLPLRSYESEAAIFSIASYQASLSRNRSKSVTSVVNSARHATEAMQHPTLPATTDARVNSNEGSYDSRTNSYIKISEQLDRCMTPVSQRASGVGSLSEFPIPPMDNPVGELPMLVSRVAALPQDANSSRAGSQRSLDDTYRAINRFNMSATLQRSRARGENLQIVEWDELPSFERAWRDKNKVLLVTIYGRKDVVLHKSDVDFIDCISNELLDDGNVPAGWVRRIFEADT